jgi:hypothetical protein
MFGLNLRDVARMEWLRFLPNIGFLSQTLQTLATSFPSSVDVTMRAAARTGGHALCR